MSQHITEYYDLFDVKRTIADNTTTVHPNYPLPTDQTSTDTTNPFIGFSNWDNFAANNPNNTVVITGQHKAPQAVTNIHIDNDGSIWCYPPNVSVPYWNKVIFRHYDYAVKPNVSNSKLTAVCDTFNNNLSTTVFVPYKSNEETPATYTPDTSDPTAMKEVQVKHITYDNVPLFVLCDEYPSRSKVVLSKGDIIKGADIELRFGYHKGQMEPIKLNLSMSCNSYINDGTYLYNPRLTTDDIMNTLIKCNFSIEWIYERETGD